MRTVSLVGWCLATIVLANAAFAGPGKIRKHNGGVKDEYLVMLQADVRPEDATRIATDLARRYDVKLETVWEYVRGFACIGKEKAIEALAEDPLVLYAEQNVIAAMPNLSSVQPTTFNGQYLWNLDRLDELTWAVSSRDNALNMCTEARNVVAYIIDYGIWRDHPEFDTRVLQTYDFSTDRTDQNATFTVGDRSNGCTATENVNPPFMTPRRAATHATAVASVLAGAHTGASRASLVSLKVVNCNSNVNFADFIDAVNFIADRNNNPYYFSPGVINHSGYIPIWDTTQFTYYGDAVERVVIVTNFPFFNSANNYSADACQFSPAYKAYTRTNTSGTVFTVGGTSTGADWNDANDYRWQTWDASNNARIGLETGSNGGQCVSIYAPANAIYVGATPPEDSSLYEVRSGTSFAAPEAAALGARYIASYTARTGLRPTYRMVYDYLLGQSQTAVVNTNTPEYWMCVTGVNGDYAFPNVSRTPLTCGTGQTLVHFNATSNTSDARMLYMDEGYCP